MAGRRIGQEALRFSGPEGGVSSLDRLADVIDWTPIEVLLGDIHAAAEGEPAWPPLALFKAMLIAVWYDLSDVKLAQALDDRASFRRFCGFSAREATPERTACVRLRQALAVRGLDKALFEAVTRQLKAKAIIASAREGDEDARLVKHKGRRAGPGFKAHVGADADTPLVEAVAVTPATVNDGKAGPDALPDDPGEGFADSVYRGEHFGAGVRAKGGTPRVIATGIWGENTRKTLSRLAAHNRPIHRVRGRIEKIFGTWKRSYGLRRMRWCGLAKAAVQVRLTAIAYNPKRSLNILPQPT